MEKKDTMCYHTLIDLYDVNFNLLNDIDMLLPVLIKISKMVNLNILDTSYHKFTPQGLTVMLLLSESHISIHTWPENGMAVCDVFTCGDHTSPASGARYMYDAMGATSHVTETFTRPLE